jgi:hypothetical protein
MDKPPVQVIYALPEGQTIEVPEDIKSDTRVKFVHGIPSLEQFNDGQHRLLIIDDQASDCGEEVVALFTRLSHHYLISVILLTQNIFLSTPGFRTMSLNAHYIVLFKAPRSMDQIACLARQICPSNSKFFQEAYADSCAEPHSYFLLDLTQQCPDNLRFRSNIFPNDSKCTTIYVPQAPSSLKKRASRKV